MTVKLNDLQRTLLLAASQNDDRRLDAAAHGIDLTTKTAIACLVRRKLLETSSTSRADNALTYRITDAGIAAVSPDERVPAQAVAVTEALSAPPTNTAVVVGLLKRPEGATLDQMVTATGWLPHTTRAALTGLRKRGHAVTRTATDDGSVYHIGTAA